MKKSLRISVALSISLFIFLSVLSFISAGDDRLLFYAKLIWTLLISFLGFCIYQNGIISKYRSILFITIAFFFFLEFKFFRFISFTKTTIPPYCHIAQAPTLFNFLNSQFLAITSGQWRVWGVLTLGFLWLLIIFTIGQGICSWVCFYGGIDEACSKIARKPLIKLKISRPWRDFPIAFLIFLLIVSFLQGLPVFCSWFCPFKMTEAFWESDPVMRITQAALFWSALVGFVIILPILTKKRTFCSLICPFGALVSLCGKVSPYKVTINKEKCTYCGKCQDLCPVFAIENKVSHEYKISNFCNRCGKCIDACPADAINILSKQTGREIDTRDIFVFLSLLVTGVISGSFVPRVFLQLIGLK
ncbi:MAG: 4Fe-4S binding protein [Candidatus Omnitrophica bacterium]|nr:4Fe-4S binding protein [Candidatus Omnitrophota bacterium]MBU1923674.1 4Fe-4S binding protein [Candidatus Omnitrophota bacterium]